MPMKLQPRGASSLGGGGILREPERSRLFTRILASEVGVKNRPERRASLPLHGGAWGSGQWGHPGVQAELPGRGMELKGPPDMLLLQTPGPPKNYELLAELLWASLCSPLN